MGQFNLAKKRRDHAGGPILTGDRVRDRRGWVNPGSANLGHIFVGVDTSSEEAWREQYWTAFYRDITFKSKDWEYEQEYRLVLTSPMGGKLEPDARTLTYRFESLKGIIFGIEMSEDDKLRIIEIVERKCRENNRHDFQFYQAYYSQKDGTIDRYPLTINLAGLSEADADSRN